MSRSSEIARRLSTKTSLEDTNKLNILERTNLWPRFAKVRDAIALALKGDGTKNIDITNWSGVDAGIHDLHGNLSVDTN